MKRFLLSLPGAIAVIGIITLAIIGSTFLYTTNTLTQGSGSREVMQIIISLVILGASLYIILSKKYDDDVQKWAFGAIGTVIGYWLPSTSN
jgi:hypothetical protein